MDLICSPRQENKILVKTRQTTKAMIPKQVFIEVTHRCNLKCVHCYLEGSCVNELSTHEFKNILDQFSDLGVFFIGFTGGEVFVRPDFLEIADYARAKGIFYHIQTNGTFINEEIAERIRKLNPTKVEISIYGATAKTHDAITGVAGSFERSVAALRHLRERNIRISMKTTIMNKNLAELRDLELLASEIGAIFIPDPLISPGIKSSKDPIRYRLTDEQFKKFMVERSWHKETEVNKVKVPLERKLICTAGLTKCTVAPDGHVYPCVLWRMSAGNLDKELFMDVWQGQLFKEIRSVKLEDLSVCSKCEGANWCVRCPGFAYLEREDFLAPSPENCRMVKNLLEVREVDR